VEIITADLARSSIMANPNAGMSNPIPVRRLEAAWEFSVWAFSQLRFSGFASRQQSADPWQNFYA
jgi:hypothetical protein